MKLFTVYVLFELSDSCRLHNPNTKFNGMETWNLICLYSFSGELDLTSQAGPVRIGGWVESQNLVGWSAGCRYHGPDGWAPRDVI